MKSSGLQSGSALIYTGTCRLLGVSCTADVGKTITITVEDNITAEGTNIKAFGMACGGTAQSYGANNYVIRFSRDDNLFCDNGLYASLSAAQGDYIIYFEPM